MKRFVPGTLLMIFVTGCAVSQPLPPGPNHPANSEAAETLSSAPSLLAIGNAMQADDQRTSQSGGQQHEH